MIMTVYMCITISPSVRETKSEVKLTEQNDSPVKTGAGVGLSSRREK